MRKGRGLRDQIQGSTDPLSREEPEGALPPTKKEGREKESFYQNSLSAHEGASQHAKPIDSELFLPGLGEQEADVEEDTAVERSGQRSTTELSLFHY